MGMTYAQKLLARSVGKREVAVGDVLEPDDGVLGIGSGGPYAVAAARGLLKHSALSAREVVAESLAIAAGICVFTNDRFSIEELDAVK